MGDLVGDPKRKASAIEDSKHDAFIERVKSLRARKIETINVVILMHKVCPHQPIPVIATRYHFQILASNKRFLEDQNLNAEARLAGLMKEENIVLQEMEDDSDEDGNYLTNLQGIDLEYHSKPGELVYVWFDYE